MSLNSTPKQPLKISDLYPDLDEGDQAKIEFNMKRYLALVWRIYERNRTENQSLLTDSQKPAIVKRPASEGGPSHSPAAASPLQI